MKLLILIAAVIIGTAFADQRKLDEKWSKYVNEFKKNYRNSQEFLKRKNIFSSNLETVERHNKEADEGKHTFWMKVNQYADLTASEFTQILTNNNSPMQRSELKAGQVFEYDKNLKTPKSFDWRNENAVTPVRNQGACGSCFSFAATAAIESHHLIKKQESLDVSEQQIVDCSYEQGNQGCLGGLMTNSFEYILKAGGLVSEETYPYKVTETTCVNPEPSKVIVKLAGYSTVQRGSERALQQALVHRGPVAVGIQALPDFHLYSHGVYSNRNCTVSFLGLNHAVLAVGYGFIEEGFSLFPNYWIVKNSWGETWGMNGYGWMAKDMFNQCGISSMASFPIMEDN